jgi:hypothetical protein
MLKTVTIALFKEAPENDPKKYPLGNVRIEIAGEKEEIEKAIKGLEEGQMVWVSKRYMTEFGSEVQLTYGIIKENEVYSIEETLSINELQMAIKTGKIKWGNHDVDNRTYRLNHVNEVYEVIFGN